MAETPTPGSRTPGQRTVQFFADQIRLAGTLYVPAGAPPPAGWPGLVFCHGFGATREYVAGDIAVALARRGYAVLTIDHRGFGESDGARWRMLPYEQVSDIRCATVFLGTCDEVDPDRIGLYGISFGGAHAIVAAASEPTIRATVACVPFSDGSAWMRAMRRYWEWCELRAELARDRVQAVLTGRSAEVDPDQILVRDPESIEWNEWLKASYPSRSGYRLPLETAQAIIEYVPLRYVDRVRGLLVVAVDQDTLIPPEQPAALYAAAGEPKRLVVLPDATHHDIYRGEHFDRVIAEAADWLDRQLA